MGYIARHSLGIYDETGLNKSVETYNICIDADKKQIVVNYREVLISSTGVTVKILKEGTFVRWNRPESEGVQANMAYDETMQSQVGNLILQMHNATLSQYPNIE